MSAPSYPDPRQQPPQGQYQPYPGQQDPRGYGPPTPAAPKKRRRWPWIVGGIVALFVVVQVANGGERPAPTTTQAADVAAIPSVVAPAPAPAVVAPVAPAPVPVAPPAPAEPQMTVSQENALQSADSYLDFSGFSRSGLIKQLEYEGYSTADATFAVDTVTVDWFVQAERSAESYMEFSSFSRSGLIGQLDYEGFTSAQAEHGANSVGL
ncbi:Ltp family lipoprotein [Pseudonocardia saturnea]